MKNYPEWNDRKVLIDLRNKFCTLYKNDDGSMFYIEPVFYAQLQHFHDLVPSRYLDILKEMDRVTKKYKLVVFTGDDEEPITFVDENVKHVVLGIHDITDRLEIYIEEKNFQGDYTD